MFDWSLMLCVKLLVVDRIYPQSNKFVVAVKNKDTGDSKRLLDRPVFLKLIDKKYLKRMLNQT